MNSKGLFEPGRLTTLEPNGTLSPELRPSNQMELESRIGQDYMSIAALWDVLLKHRWTVITVAVVFTTIIAIMTLRMKPVYKASARIQVEAEAPLIQSVTGLIQYQQSWDYDDTFLETQIEILKSDELARRTVEEMRLGDNLKFAPPISSNQSSVDRRQDLAAMLKGGLDVQLVPKTRMLLVSYEGSDPNLTAQITNSLVRNYVDYSFRTKYDSARQASVWMEQQLDELKAKVEKSQKALIDYERSHSIVSADGDKQPVQDQMLSDVQKDLMAAQSDRILKESIYNGAKMNRGQVAGLAHNGLLLKLEEKLVDLNGQLGEVTNQYGPNYPKALRIQQQIALVQTQIDQEQERVLERARGDYLTALAREKMALVALNQQKDDLGKQNQLLVEHNILKREFDANQQLYQNLLQKLKDATVSAGLRSTNIHMVDEAVVPKVPIRPRKLMNISVGLFAGLFIGIMVAFAYEALDQSVKSVIEIESLLGTPAIAIIPMDRNLRLGNWLQRKSSDSGLTEGGQDKVALASILRPRSVLAEAYRALRTAVLLALPGKPPKTILITSTKSGEGKTVTSINLAEVLAQRKGPVVLVDCDLRKSGIAKSLNLDKNEGLSGYLSKDISLESVLVNHPGLPELMVLPAGISADNPAELLSSDKMLELINELSTRFEHVVIDSPPVLAVTDAAILSGMVDGVLLIVEGGKTIKGAMARSHRTLISSGGRVLGVVFNKYDHRREGAYGYGSYYHYYPYAYGNEEGQ